MHHYDWKGGRGPDRVSSFMVYVDADCAGGGTNFPRLDMASEKWCTSGFVDCDGSGENEGLDESKRGRETTEGVTFKPVKGNAVFWGNLSPDGSGYDQTWHAGLPVLTGSKIGLNIWTVSDYLVPTHLSAVYFVHDLFRRQSSMGKLTL